VTEPTAAKPTLDRTSVVSLAAERLITAAATGVPTAPVRDLLGTTDTALAYEVQRVLTKTRLAAGRTITGHKIGLTSLAVQRQLGVGQPDFGVLFDDMPVPSGGEADSARLIQPRAEAEIAFVLAKDLDGFGAGQELDAPVDAAGRQAVAGAVDYAVAALEIVDSRVAGWDITITDTIADNASSGLYVLGERRVRLSEFTPGEVTMTLDKNGELASSGDGAACLGDPLNALAWLARIAAAFGAPLRAGDVILSGALGAMVAAEPGTEITAELSALGRVRVTFSKLRTRALNARTKVAVIGSGNIGTDLMIKVMRLSQNLEMGAMAGIDPASDGLARAARMRVPTTAEGVDGLIGLPGFDEIGIVFDATSARAHIANAAKLAPYGKRLIDLTPAATGPFVVPAVNLGEHLNAPDINMVTCGGQATIPIVAAVSRVTQVCYAEIVASIASKSAGPGTRANIDEFTETTARAIETVGGARRGKAIIILNPADPPLIMRDTVFCLTDDADRGAIEESVRQLVAAVAEYVPGYRLKQQVQFTAVGDDEPVHTLVPAGTTRPTTKVSVFLEVEGAAHYLPGYAGNLDIMTSAAVQVAERLAARPAPEPALTEGNR